MTKTCSICGEPVGQRNRSRLCRKCYRKVWREDHKEDLAARGKVYRDANKESIAAYQKVYRRDNKEAMVVKDKVYYEANRGRITAKAKIYREDNKQSIAVRGKVYYDANKTSIAAREKVYREDNKEVIAARGKVYRNANPEKVREWKKNNPEKVREHRHNRRTYLCDYGDCKKLNQWFSGCEGHHIDPDTIIHIPARMHNAIYHSLRTGQGMDKINHLAFDWLDGVRRDSPQTTFEAFG